MYRHQQHVTDTCKKNNQTNQHAQMHVRHVEKYELRQIHTSNKQGCDCEQNNGEEAFAPRSSVSA